MKKIESKIQVRIPKNVERLLFYAGGLFLVIFVYVFVFQNLQLKNQELDTKVSHLRTEESQLLEMKKSQKDNKAAIISMQSEIADMLERYPADVMEEDAIRYAYKVEDGLDISITNISFNQRNLVTTGEKSGYQLMVTPITYTYSVGYNDLKKFISDFQQVGDMRNVESISLGYDADTGLLFGVMDANHYSIEGGDQVYKPTGDEQLSIGNENIFGTAK